MDPNHLILCHRLWDRNKDPILHHPYNIHSKGNYLPQQQKYYQI